MIDDGCDFFDLYYLHTHEQSSHTMATVYKMTAYTVSEAPPRSQWAKSCLARHTFGSSQAFLATQPHAPRAAAKSFATALILAGDDIMHAHIRLRGITSAFICYRLIDASRPIPMRASMRDVPMNMMSSPPIYMEDFKYWLA